MKAACFFYIYLQIGMAFSILLQDALFILPFTPPPFYLIERSMTTRLFMTDGFYWIHVGRFLGRDVAEEHTDKHTYQERHIDAPCRYTRRHT